MSLGANSVPPTENPSLLFVVDEIKLASSTCDFPFVLCIACNSYNYDDVYYYGSSHLMSKLFPEEMGVNPDIKFDPYRFKVLVFDQFKDFPLFCEAMSLAFDDVSFIFM